VEFFNLAPEEPRWCYVLWKGTDEVLFKGFESPKTVFNTFKDLGGVVGTKRTQCNDRQWVFQYWGR
jgi:hypothetical protein